MPTKSALPPNLARRIFYSEGHPTRAGRVANRLMAIWSGLGLPPSLQAVLEVKRRQSGRKQTLPVVIARVDGERYLVSMLGPNSEWVKNVLARDGKAALRRGRREKVRLVPVPVGERAPILKEYVRIAPGGRRHFPTPVGAPLSDFEAIADRYPVFRIEPR